jgi:mono/diheme cytochrome c family protein
MALRGTPSVSSFVVVAFAGLGLASGAMAAMTHDASALVAHGRVVYEQQCAACHGAKAEGVRDWEQRDSHGELPAPPHDRRGHTWKHSDAMLYRIVRQGWRDPFNKTERLTMPAFDGKLSRDDTIAVIAYLKTLWTPEQRRFQGEESRGHPFPPATD